MLRGARSYEEACRTFRWRLPAQYNIAVDVCDRLATGGADGHRTALVVEQADGTVDRHTFHTLRLLSNRLANALAVRGVRAGDRVAVLFGPSLEAAVALLAALKLGAVAVPLSPRLEAAELRRRLGLVGATVALADGCALTPLLAARAALPELKAVWSTDPAEGVTEFWSGLERGGDDFTAADTKPADPALLLFTAGTAGPAKAVLLGHRALLGHLPAVGWTHESFPYVGDLMWSPAEWHTPAGLLATLLPAWHHGVPVLAVDFGGAFDGARAISAMAAHRVRNVLLTAPAVRAMRRERRGRGLALRTVVVWGAALDAATMEWGRGLFGVPLNPLYGQTEAGMVLGDRVRLGDWQPGALGRPIPGHAVEIVDAAGRPLPAGALGTVGVHRDDPAVFLEYWRDLDATEQRFAGNWLLTGDMGRRDLDGFYWLEGRADVGPDAARATLDPEPLEPISLTAPNAEDRWR